MNGDKAFLDTNVLIYMYSSADPGKRIRAQELFDRHLESNRILISTQVVQEFYAVGSRKLDIPRRQLGEIAARLLDLSPIVVGPAHIASAIQTSELHQISFWDSLILAAAQSGGASVLYTEDLNDGQQYGTVTVRNPFRNN